MGERSSPVGSGNLIIAKAELKEKDYYKNKIFGGKMKKAIFLLLVILLFVFSCASESESDAYGKIKKAELALKNLSQLLDKYNQVNKHFPYLSEDIIEIEYSAILSIDENGIVITQNDISIDLPLISDSADFHTGLGKVFCQDNKYIMRRYVAYESRKIDTLNTELFFNSIENLSSVIRVKDTVIFIAIRSGDSTIPYHIYNMQDNHLLTITDSGYIEFIYGNYNLTYKEIIADENKQLERNASWLYDTLISYGDTTDLNKIKKAFELDSLRYISTDPLRKYFLFTSATDQNKTIVSTRRIIKSFNDLSVDNISSLDPWIVLGINNIEEEIIETEEILDSIVEE